MSYKTLPKSKLTGVPYSLRTHYDNGIQDATEGKPPRHTFEKLNDFTEAYQEGYLSVQGTVIKKGKKK